MSTCLKDKKKHNLLKRSLYALTVNVGAAIQSNPAAEGVGIGGKKRGTAKQNSMG